MMLLMDNDDTHKLMLCGLCCVMMMMMIPADDHGMLEWFFIRHFISVFYVLRIIIVLSQINVNQKSAQLHIPHTESASLVQQAAKATSITTTILGMNRFFL